MRRLIVTLSAAAIAAAGAIADGRGGRAGGHRPALRAAADDRRGDRRVGGFPSGAVTFMFSDIEGSTRLVKALRERYPQVLAEHRKLVRAAITGQAGYEVDTQGDAFFVAFPSAKQAALAGVSSPPD
jgi:class 3 adenylate cyclase